MKADDFQVKAIIEATAATDQLTERESYFIGLAVTMTRGCIACTGGRIEKATEVGVDKETLRAAIDLAAAVNAGVTLRTAIEGAAVSGS